MSNSTGTNIGTNLFLATFGTAVLALIQWDQNSSQIPVETIAYQQLTNNSWDETISLVSIPIDPKINLLKGFSENLIKNTKNIEPEILEVLNKNYWDLL